MPERPFLTRRAFLTESAAAAAAVAIAPNFRANAQSAPEFVSQWDSTPDRVWPGPEYWTNPLQDWRIAGGRLECIEPSTGRNMHVLTRELSHRQGTLDLTVEVGRIDGGPIREGRGSVGFTIGVQGPLKDYRNALIFGNGLNAGLRAGGEIFIGVGAGAVTSKVTLDSAEVELRLRAEPAGAGYRIVLEALDAKDRQVIGSIEKAGVPADRLVGNIRLTSNFGQARPRQAQSQADNGGRWWFRALRIGGTKVSAHPERAFGPILFAQYTIHRGTLRLTAQMPPLGAEDNQRVRLQFKRNGQWQGGGEAPIHRLARIAAFSVENWNSQEQVPYRLVYSLCQKNGTNTESYFEGEIRPEPREQDVLTVADISCNAHYAFPNAACVENVTKLNPDLLAFTGDQYYEPSGGFGVDRRSAKSSILDALRKWYLHGWTWRDLTRNRPSISIPDDHDVYHGNLWGEGGIATPGYDGNAESQGGYKMSPDFVNAVHLMQTSHHPTSPAPPGKQRISGYYGPLTYAGISFAILADRQYKTGPNGEVPPTTSGRADHVIDPNFDPKAADRPNLELLGKDQMAFLRDWVTDWTDAEMKAAISQTLFTAMATHHGRKFDRLVADYDTNGWPQTARNAALIELRRAFAFHITGDQHLPAVVHYGIDEHRDAVVAFASPAVNNLYPRAFRPPNTDQTTGDFRDSFGHPMTVLACANPKAEIRQGVLEAEMDKSSGYGVVRFNKKTREIIVECWPLLADPAKPGTQFPGWPVTIPQLDNYARAAVAHLPEVRVVGVNKPVIEIIDETSGQLVYSLRLAKRTWRPHTFRAGPHTIRVRVPETGKIAEQKHIEATKDNNETLEFTIQA